MSDTIIKVGGIGKKYRIRHKQTEGYSSLRDVIANNVRRAFQATGTGEEKLPAIEDFWALKDVSFEVKRGEVVGVIGRNGAGKSTLLKILSRITDPTKGRAEIDGRVASLLEVGTGFHPELTGRENIYLNGAILGMTRNEIKRKFDEIVNFAEVEKFLDTSVKHYSSGMYVRLAFAVAAHLEPEILIVDEVLAIGDIEFQKKCLGKLKNAAMSEGQTTLFVSHNMAAVQTLCNKVMFLRSGLVAGIGEVDTQIEKYLGDRPQNAFLGMSGQRQLSSTLKIDFLNFTPNLIVSGSSCSFSLQISSMEVAQVREILMLFYSTLGARISIIDLRSSRIDYRLAAGKPLKLQGLIHSMPLVEGDYAIGMYILCGDFNADVYDLATVSISSNQTNVEFPPYPPHDRGVLELPCTFGAA